MVTYNRQAAGMGYVGIPALIFFELANYGRGSQTYEEKRVTLHKIYAYLRAYLPIIYEIRGESYNNSEIPDMITEASKRIEKARDLYSPTYESLKTCNPDEKLFQTAIDSVFECLSEIVAISKIIDKEKLVGEEVYF